MPLGALRRRFCGWRSVLPPLHLLPMGGDPNTPNEGDYGNVDSLSGNVVVVDTAVAGNVYGAYLGISTTTSGATAEKNNVTISETSVGKQVFGAWIGGSLDSPDATNRAIGNHIAVIDSSTGAIHGAYVTSSRGGNAIAQDNSASLSGTNLKSDIFGGYAYAAGIASSIGNQVTISEGSDIVDLKAAGGFANSNDGAAIASQNVMDVYVDNKAHDNTFITGGEATSVDGQAFANGNNVTAHLSGDQSGVYSIKGGAAYTDSLSESSFASGNTVTVNGSGFATAIYGGEALAYGTDQSGLNPTNSEANNNTLILNGVSVIQDQYGYGSVAFGGYTNTGVSDGNTVVMNGGSAQYVQGGTTDYGNSASNNTVLINGAEVTYRAFGGVVNSGERGVANNNTLKIDGGNVYEAFGGSSNSSTGVATGNQVVVTAGKVGQAIYGGYSWNGNATGNTVKIAGEADVSEATLYGGFGDGEGADLRTGNTLNVSETNGTGFTAQNIVNFETINLTLGDIPQDDHAVLELVGVSSTDLTQTVVRFNAAVRGGQSLAAGTRFTLIQNENGLKTSDTTLSSDTTNVQQGIALNHQFSIEQSADGNSLEAVLTKTTVNQAVGIFNTSRLATVGFLSEASDFALDVGVRKALDTVEAKGVGLYGTVSGGHMQQDFDKGGSADVTGTHWLLGLAAKLNDSGDYDLIGNFYAEAGRGNVDGDDSGASGSGDTYYYGLGFIGRYQQNEGAMQGVYAQLNAKIGRSKTDFDSNLHDAFGRRGSYDEDLTYYGFGVGVGYLWNLSSAFEVDLYARYQWLHLEGYDADIANDPYQFDDIDSHRTRVGARVNIKANEICTPYVGLTWDHEFSAEAKGSVYGYSLVEDSLKGDTGIAEIGVSFAPSAQTAWRIDGNVQGYVGQREGVAGSLTFEYIF